MKIVEKKIWNIFRLNSISFSTKEFKRTKFLYVLFSMWNDTNVSFKHIYIYICERLSNLTFLKASFLVWNLLIISYFKFPCHLERWCLASESFSYDDVHIIILRIETGFFNLWTQTNWFFDFEVLKKDRFCQETSETAQFCIKQKITFSYGSLSICSWKILEVEA